MDNKGNNRIEELLGSLDGVKRAKAPDFFYTRLKARMIAELEGEKSGSKNSSPKWVLKPVYIVSVLLLVLAVNAFVFLKGQDETPAADNSVTVQQSIASEYNLYDLNSVYDLNQDK